jgi:AmmeMemoRadiSam system protein B
MERSNEYPIREAAVAGSFYPADPAATRRFLSGKVAESVEPAVAVLVPHAGWIYAGALAWQVLSGIAVPRRVFLIGPNHTGRGARVSVYPGGCWRLPLGDVPIDHAAAALILERCQGAQADTLAHQREHCLEVLVPMLMARRSNVQIVPIVLGPLAVDQALDLGRQLATVINFLGGTEESLLVISSDMSHYLPAEAARREDELVMDRMDKLDASGVYHVVFKNHISMCGVVAATVGLAAARLLGAVRAERVGYTNSGEVTGDSSSVVAYVGYKFLR